ncbi:MAG: hypothetical protein WCO58_01115 [bacterium]
MDSIHLLSNKIKAIKAVITKEFWVTVAVLTIISICSFIGGFLIGKGSQERPAEDPVLIYGVNTYNTQKSALSVQNKPINKTQMSSIQSTASYFASKRGKKYYPINCLSSSKLKVENRVYFESAEQAEAKGLSSSDGC